MPASTYFLSYLVPWIALEMFGGFWIGHVFFPSEDRNCHVGESVLAFVFKNRNIFTLVEFDFDIRLRRILHTS